MRSSKTSHAIDEARVSSFSMATAPQKTKVKTSIKRFAVRTPHLALLAAYSLVTSVGRSHHKFFGAGVKNPSRVTLP
jgi:hypothetical protein